MLEDLRGFVVGALGEARASAVEAEGPFEASVILCGSCMVFCLVASWFTGDYSFVDRLWSVTPFAYATLYAVHGDYDPRLVIMASLATAWGLRLSYNFYRKGGYQIGNEDYRWPIVKSWFKGNAFLWQLFNVGFICGYQHFLLWLIATPALVAYNNRGAPLNNWDLAAAAGFVCMLVLETAADQQQWQFQQSKYNKMKRLKHLKGDYKRGFLTSGLFRYSRHPNFFAEQSMWWCFYLFSVASSLGKPQPPPQGFLDKILGALGMAAQQDSAEPEVLNWTIAGAVLLSLLFQGSTPLTEAISLKKYPAYESYQKTVSMLLPLPPKSSP
ncbi:DUF1295 domain-containing protein [Chloropicon primus]|uniref:DUF1295 domain-containing protein n=1 Tax=Chloropicon primus TaxID=1764295 RepID=A0A5B8MXF1_9CHLO|nr:DUF1295 domain-containing protein [Chloropicon primus]UPR03359.1 DUF1295 domain-containing protein [Chloropicon primus]|eukprot:QDZ24150.1 DUF1295 domain-containing protein [Chloropicon primus]